VSPASRASFVTCLGCGCACDDLTVQIADGRIADISPPCPVGRAWFGDGRVPGRILRGGAEVALEAALADAAETLAGARGGVLVLLAPDLSTQGQRAALAVADLLCATVDTATSGPAAAGLLAAQRRGRAAATLGEVRNRADVLLFWGVDPGPRYPRFLSRYALDPVGTHVTRGRAGRTVISVDIGRDRGPAGAESALVLAPDQEIAALSVMRAVALGNALGELPPALQAAADAAARLTTAAYAVLVHDGEPGEEPGRDAYRAEGLIALEYLGDETVTVAAGTFECHKFRYSDEDAGFVSKDGAHPTYDVWVTADEDSIFVKGGVGGYMQTWYELVELER